MQIKYKIKKIEDSSLKLINTDESKFSINYKNLLNQAQYEAVSSIEGAYLLIAGAGTGKTRTLVYRVARLVESGFDPKSILLLTFTRKASKEMMDRASLLLDDRCSKILGGTFHSFANSTLRRYAKYAGIDPQFTILDQSDSEDVINLIRVQLNFDKLKKRFPNKETIFKVLSLHTNTFSSIENIIAEEYPHFMEFTEEVKQISNFYKNYKKKNNLLDYDDLLIYLNEFLQNGNEAAKSFLDRINFVMVDEYQDTNKLQAETIISLSKAKQNIMVVGDDSQSIYSFRGADFRNIMEFPSLFENVKIIKLEENYRSTQEILDFTNYIIENAVEKYEKYLFTNKNGGELPAVISAANDNMQSRFIVQRIIELREEGIPLKEIAVLFRSSFFSFDLEIELTKANIPFVKFGGMKFIETAHVKDVLAFLRIAANPKDIVSWYRVLLLHEGIGSKSAQKFLEELANYNSDFIDGEKDKVFQNNKFLSKLIKLLELVNTLRKKKMTPSEMTEVIFEYYIPLFKQKFDDFNKRRKDLEIFLNITQNYELLEELLTDMALDPPRDSVVDVDGEDKEDEFVTLSTIHSAKGLEWHSVFIIHAIEGLFPSSQSFNDLDAIEEERRLMYVASTRAKQNLYICYPMKIFDRINGITFSKPSRFIMETKKDLIVNWDIIEE